MCMSLLLAWSEIKDEFQPSQVNSRVGLLLHGSKCDELVVPRLWWRRWRGWQRQRPGCIAHQWWKSYLFWRCSICTSSLTDLTGCKSSPFTNWLIRSIQPEPSHSTLFKNANGKVPMVSVTWNASLLPLSLLLSSPMPCMSSTILNIYPPVLCYTQRPEFPLIYGTQMRLWSNKKFRWVSFVCPSPARHFSGEWNEMISAWTFRWFDVSVHSSSLSLFGAQQPARFPYNHHYLPLPPITILL